MNYDKDYFEAPSVPKEANYSGYLSYDKHRESLKRDFQDLIRSVVKPGQRILDIGCATGTALEAARDLGVAESDLFGLDISEYAVTRARKYLPHASFCEDEILRADIGDDYDVIFLFDILEHVATPEVIMEKAAAALKFGGKILASTPDPESWLSKLSGSRWNELRPGEHLCFVDRKWFERMCKKLGLKLKTVKHHGKRVTLEHATLRLKSYLPFFPVLRSQRMIYLNTFDRLYVVIEK